MVQRSLLAICALVLSCGTGTSQPGFHPTQLPPGANQGRQLQGRQLQGRQLQGRQLQGTGLVGTAPTEPAIYHRYDSWFRDGWLSRARVVAGKIAVSGENGPLSQADLVGAWIPADDGGSRAWTVIRAVTQDSTYADGSTWLYSVDIYNPADGTFSPMCAPDLNGFAGAIPVAAIFDGTGKRVESATQFTFGCTAGVIAKCYRWGYRPYLTDAAGSSAGFASLHFACTRMARADYCGDGRTWTQDGTLINTWDSAPAPGPFQTHGPADPTFVFEAGWSTQGAVCLSKERWATLNPQIAQNCPSRLIAPGATTSAGTVCETAADAVGFDSTTRLFNESKANVNP